MFDKGKGKNKKEEHNAARKASSHAHMSLQKAGHPHCNMSECSSTSAVQCRPQHVHQTPVVIIEQETETI
jgi:hypothetical protein